MNESESSSASENEDAASAKPAKHDKRALVVFFSFVAGLVLLVALNMK